MPLPSTSIHPVREHNEQPFCLQMMQLTSTSALGVVNLYSAAQSSNPGLYKQQIFWIGGGLLIALVISLIDGATLELRLFDPAGNFIKSVSRKGEGPGDARRIRACVT